MERPPDWPSEIRLTVELRQLLRQVPPGWVTTFGDLAEALGDLAAAKWVAAEIQRIRDDQQESAVFPWHRVIRRTGALASGTPAQQQRQRECLSLDQCHANTHGLYQQVPRWDRFETTHPLRELAAWQSDIAARARHDVAVAVPETVAAIDVSYTSPTQAVAAYVRVDVASQRVLDEVTCPCDTPFPYISGYLTFRELPPLLAVLERVRREGPLADVVLVDGAGSLHPRGCGIAVGVGVMADCTTIGVAKHRLCGQIRNEPELARGRPIWLQDECRGMAYDGSFGRRDFDISPGHRIDLASALEVVRRVWIDSRGPLPIVLADRLSRRIAKHVAPQP